MKYRRKKPEIIKAVQITEDMLSSGTWHVFMQKMPLYFMHELMCIAPNDWVVNENGKLKLYTNYEFEKTYEIVE